METDLHLHILEYQASLKHENFTLHNITATPYYYRKTFCSYSYIFCTLYSINNLRFIKIRLSWNDNYHLLVPIFFIWTVVICSNIYATCESE